MGTRWGWFWTVNGDGCDDSSPPGSSLSSSGRCPHTSTHVVISSVGGYQFVCIEGDGGGWKSPEVKGFITIKTLFFLPSIWRWGEEGVCMESKSFKDRLCLHRRRFKDRVIIAYSGSRFGNARGLMWGCVSHISSVGIFSSYSFKKWFIFMMIDTYVHWWRSLVVAKSSGEGVGGAPWNVSIRASMFPVLVVLGYPGGSQVNARLMCFNERLLKGKCVVFWTIKSYVNYWPLGNHFPWGHV